MKKIFLAFTLFAFVGTMAIANYTNAEGVTTELTQDKKKDKKKCKKGDKACCKKEEAKTSCSKGEKKACCKKGKTTEKAEESAK